jgi:hypothetical protein
MRGLGGGASGSRWRGNGSGRYGSGGGGASEPGCAAHGKHIAADRQHHTAPNRFDARSKSDGAGQQRSTLNESQQHDSGDHAEHIADCTWFERKSRSTRQRYEQ